VTRTEYDGAITVLADGWQGRPLNSPNDVVVGRDGSVWFTDPAFGIAGDYEGYPAPAELPTDLYRLDGTTGELSVAATGLRSPNGLAFSPDESRLYVVESHGVPNPDIVVFDVAEGRLAGRRVLVDAGDGSPDGLRVDRDGNLWCGWGMGTPASSPRTAPPSGTSPCPSGAPTSPSAARRATASSWPPRRRSTRSTSTPAAPADVDPPRHAPRCRGHHPRAAAGHRSTGIQTRIVDGPRFAHDA
jgi:sugar lactone lactonase YvrE